MLSGGIFSGSKLGQGPWRPGKKVWSIAIFGSSEIDFRQAELEEDVTKIVAFSFFGGSKVLVPPDMPATLSGFSIFGGRDVKRNQATLASSASAKGLHIQAISIFGGFKLTE